MTIDASSDAATPESRTYRAWVGNPEKYDVMAAMQFAVMTGIGLRDHHTLLDVGCGSLRGGRLFIAYLGPERYFGIEPESWLIDEAIEKEIGRDQIRIKRPTFSDVADFRLSVFGRRFDFVLAQSIFSHASETMIRRCLGEARETLEPNGVLAATYLPGDADYRGEEWVYPECIAYRPETFAGFVREAGLTLHQFPWPHLSGQAWTLITHAGHEPKFPPHSLGWIVDDHAKLRSRLDRIGRSRAYAIYRAARRLAGRAR